MKPLTGREVLWHVWTLIRTSNPLNDVIAATTAETVDNVVASYGDLNGRLC